MPMPLYSDSEPSSGESPAEAGVSASGSTSRSSAIGSLFATVAVVLAAAVVLSAARRGRQDASPPANPIADRAASTLADGRLRASPGLAGGAEALLPVLYPSSHAANLLLLRNGDLLSVWFSGAWEGDSGVGIVLSRLKRGAQQWSETRLIDRRVGESFQNPMLFEAPDGVLHLYHTTQPAGGGEAGARVLTLTSADGGLTWTEPRPLFSKPGAYTRHPMVVLADGTWLLPLTYVTSKGIGEGAETNFSAMELSRDRGATWKECIVPNSQGKVQPTVVQLAPGHLLALFRSRAADFIYRSESTGGCDWIAPTATLLPNNNASVQMTRLRDGHLVVVFDNSSVNRGGPKPQIGLRKPLSIALSEDGGATWPYVRDIEAGRSGFGEAEAKPKAPGREEYSYPTVLQTPDGLVHVAYTFRRETIKTVSFPESWVRGGPTTGQYNPAPLRAYPPN